MDSLEQALQNIFGDAPFLPASKVRNFLTRRIYDEARRDRKLTGSNKAAKLQRYYARGEVYRVAREAWYSLDVSIAAEARETVEKAFSRPGRK